MADHDGWFDKPENSKRIFRIFYALCVVVLLSEFLIDKKGKHHLEELPFFHGVYGFLSIVVIVFLSVGLRKLVLRSESYYRDEPDVSAKPQSEEGAHD